MEITREEFIRILNEEDKMRKWQKISRHTDDLNQNKIVKKIKTGK